MKKAFNSMKNLPLINDILYSEEITFSYEEDKPQITNTSHDHFKLYKIPRYLEKVR